MRKYLCTLLIFWTFPVQSQQALEAYIRVGLENNEVLKQQDFNLQKSIYALKEANGLFLPKISLEGNYFLAGGGRTVDFPAGDILNPVYSTLNQLTESSNFPMIENERILLNPDNFYDIRVRTAMPLFNAELVYNRRIKSEMVSMQQLEKAVYQRELVKDIKTAYFKYLKSLEAIKIFETALQSVEENRRINAALFQNNQINRGVLIRAENEVIRFQTQIDAAIQESYSAQSHFNFLLNRKLDESISVDEIAPIIENVDFSKNSSDREELRQLDLSNQINEHLLGLSKSYLLPQLSAFIDLGSQGFEWEYNNKTQYYFFGLAMQWNIFAGGQNKYRKKQAEMDQAFTNSQRDNVAEQFLLQQKVSMNNFKATYSQYNGAVKQAESSERAYKDSSKRYKEGQILFIELLDDQNQWISAKLQENISLYECLIKVAETERANASFNLNAN
ncbi:TolC family protein [Pleomorphovibrio marinus]|uniref:TolC family protein n=1 Tax=Pleomorphovibrio marinus TaxID=2164132 RepID=UPI000E0C5D39|nr:TolC family protein [Pleomorphovibrio marinus]